MLYDCMNKQLLLYVRVSSVLLRYHFIFSLHLWEKPNISRLPGQESVCEIKRGG